MIRFWIAFLMAFSFQVVQAQDASLQVQTRPGMVLSPENLTLLLIWRGDDPSDPMATAEDHLVIPVNPQGLSTAEKGQLQQDALLKQFHFAFERAELGRPYFNRGSEVMHARLEFSFRTLDLITYAYKDPDLKKERVQIPDVVSIKLLTSLNIDPKDFGTEQPFEWPPHSGGRHGRLFFKVVVRP